jgi:hypothetical protein
MPQCFNDSIVSYPIMTHKVTLIPGDGIGS